MARPRNTIRLLVLLATMFSLLFAWRLLLASTASAVERGQVQVNIEGKQAFDRTQQRYKHRFAVVTGFLQLELYCGSQFLLPFPRMKNPMLPAVRPYVVHPSPESYKYFRSAHYYDGAQNWEL